MKKAKPKKVKKPKKTHNQILDEEESKEP